MEKPSLYLLRGDDQTHIREILNSFKAELGDLAEMNTTLMNGESLNLESLRADSLTMPFLATRRLLVIENARQLLTKTPKDRQAVFLSLLDDIPETTALVLILADQQIRRRGELYWENARSYQWLVDWIGQNPARAYIADCALPSEADMPGWVLKTAKDAGGDFRSEAAYLLASYVGTDTLRAAQEIQKLLTYVNYDRPVTNEDVALLTAQEQEGNIFALVDAMGERNGANAIEQFKILSEKSEILALTGMIHRQFRLLIQAREILDEGGSSRQVEQELHLPGFVAAKISAQAQRFSMDQLLGIFGGLLQIDEDMKSGGMPGDVALELLIAQTTASRV